MENFKSILENQLRIPGKVIEQILPYAEFQVDINEAEYNWLLQLLPLLQNATPRNIRILYYQYILTKRLLKKNIELHNSIRQKKSGITVLIDLLFVVSLYRFYREIPKLHDYLSNSKFDELKQELKSKCPEKGEMCVAIISEIEKIASDELIELLRLIEIVVAY